jgi:hypothetical protein
VAGGVFGIPHLPYATYLPALTGGTVLRLSRPTLVRVSTIMRSRLVLAWAWIGVVGFAAVVAGSTAWAMEKTTAKTADKTDKAAAAPAPAGDAKLVPLGIELPKPLYKETPKDIQPAATLEPYDEKKERPAFLAPAGVKNLALKKKVTSSDSDPIIGELSFVTDGLKEGTDGGYVELGPGTQWVQIDLGATADIYAVLVWHYHAAGRVYHSVVVQVSDDAAFKTGVQTIFNNDFANASKLGVGKQLEYIDDFRGKLIDAKDEKGQPAKGRYVRLYSKGNTSTDMNHYVEVEVFGK